MNIAWRQIQTFKLFFIILNVRAFASNKKQCVIWSLDDSLDDRAGNAGMGTGPVGWFGWAIQKDQSGKSIPGWSNKFLMIQELSGICDCVEQQKWSRCFGISQEPVIAAGGWDAVIPTDETNRLGAFAWQHKRAFG